MSEPSQESQYDPIQGVAVRLNPIRGRRTHSNKLLVRLNATRARTTTIQGVVRRRNTNSLTHYILLALLRPHTRRVVRPNISLFFHRVQGVVRRAIPTARHIIRALLRAHSRRVVRPNMSFFFHRLLRTSKGIINRYSGGPSIMRVCDRRFHPHYSGHPHYISWSI